MTPNARRIVEKRKQRSAEVQKRIWQEMDRLNAESVQASQEARTQYEKQQLENYEARFKRAVRY